jgi:uncharacterized membrane-anchored protein
MKLYRRIITVSPHMKTIWKATAALAVWLAALSIAARVNTDRGIFMIFLDMSAVGIAVLAIRWYRQRKEKRMEPSSPLKPLP